MQHNLLPLSERKTLRHEYRLRALIVACFTISLACVAGLAALFPAYIRASGEERTQLNTISSLKKGKDQSGVTQIEQQLSVDNKLLSDLSGQADDPRLSSVIQSVVSARGTLALNSLALDRQASSTVLVTIQGTSPTRDALLGFKSSLEELAPGNKVDLPIEELAKSTDIQFSLRLTESLP